MTTADSTPAAHAPSLHGNVEEAHGEDHVHVYETAGIHEGNARLPKWFIVFMISLFAFAVWYVATQLGAQPSSARMK